MILNSDSSIITTMRNNDDSMILKFHDDSASKSLKWIKYTPLTPDVHSEFINTVKRGESVKDVFYAGGFGTLSEIKPFIGRITDEDSDAEHEWSIVHEFYINDTMVTGDLYI